VQNQCKEPAGATARADTADTAETAETAPRALEERYAVPLQRVHRTRLFLEQLATSTADAARLLAASALAIDHDRPRDVVQNLREVQDALAAAPTNALCGDHALRVRADHGGGTCTAGSSVRQKVNAQRAGWTINSDPQRRVRDEVTSVIAGSVLIREGDAYRTFHLRTHSPCHAKVTRLRAEVRCGQRAWSEEDAASTVLTLRPADDPSRAARELNIPIGLPPIPQGTARQIRKLLGSRAMRVTQRGQTILFRAMRAGRSGRFTLEVRGAGSEAWMLDDEAVGTDAVARVDGRPTKALEDWAEYRLGQEHLTFALCGRLAAAGSELTVHVGGGFVLPLVCATGAGGASVGRWLPMKWPLTSTGQLTTPTARQQYQISIPALNESTLGLATLPLAAVRTAAEAGRLPSNARQSILAAIRQMLRVQGRLLEAAEALEHAAVNATADLAASGLARGSRAGTSARHAA
jgi:hypothetical protein